MGGTIRCDLGDAEHEWDSVSDCTNVEFGPLDNTVVDFSGISPPCRSDVVVSSKTAPIAF